jgi:hypothetical protein
LGIRRGGERKREREREREREEKKKKFKRKEERRVDAENTLKIYARRSVVVVVYDNLVYYRASACGCFLLTSSFKQPNHSKERKHPTHSQLLEIVGKAKQICRNKDFLKRKRQAPEMAVHCIRAHCLRIVYKCFLLAVVTGGNQK